jgi:restriction system protein
MTIPDFQTLMRPVLALHEDGRPHRHAELMDDLGRSFRLSEEEVNERMAGGHRRFGSRIHWARTYLAQSGLLHRPARGITQITDRGREALSANPDRIDMSVLQQFPEFREFRSRRHPREEPEVQAEEASSPEERLEEASRELDNAVAGELLERILSSNPGFFEHLVLDLLLAMGYGGSREDAATHLGRSGDEGLDGSVAQDHLGLDTIYVQAKRWSLDRHVRRQDIQAFVGALQGARATKGVFLTTTRFSAEAETYARTVPGSRIVLIDGRRLTSMMIERGVGVTTTRTYSLKQIDEDYFLQAEESDG